MTKHENNQKDTMGKMIGWSLGTGMDKKAPAELVDLPCTFAFKVIGDAQTEYRNEIKAELEQKIGRTLETTEFSVRESAEKKYVSVTFSLYMTKLEDIYDIYALLKAHKGTRFLL